MNTADDPSIDSGTPKTKALSEGLTDAWTDLTHYIHRSMVADSVRHCVWPNQTDDGLKHRANDADDEPFPWEGASDARVRLADFLVRDAVRVGYQSFRRGRWTAAPREITDGGTALKTTQLLRYHVFTLMKPKAMRALKRALEMRHHYGLALMHVGWERRLDREPRRWTFEEILGELGLAPLVQAAEGVGLPAFLLVEQWEALAPKLPPELLQVLQPLVDRVRDTLAVIEGDDAAARREVFDEVRAALSSDDGDNQLLEAFAALRAGRRAEIRQVRVRLNRPEWRALKVGEEVLFPANVECIEDAPWVGLRAVLTKEQLRAKVAEEGWDQAFVDRMLEKAESKTLLNVRAPVGSRLFRGNLRASWDSVVEEMKGRFEVWTVYYRATGKSGVSSLFETVLCPALDSTEAAYHSECEYAHGRMPFVEFRMDADKALAESAGIPWLVHTYQTEMKTQRDAVVDFTSVSIRPNLRRHRRDMDEALVLRPGSPVYESVAGTTEWMPLPPGRPDLAKLVSDMVRADADQLVGTPNQAVPAELTQLARATLATDILDECETLLEMTLQVVQQYADERSVVRLVGPLAQPVTREEIQGRYDLSIVFDGRELDPEFAASKAEQLTSVLGIDTMGIIDRRALVELVLRNIDPQAAEALLTDPNQASEQEIRDEQQNIALLMTGQEPRMADKGQNFGLRLQVLQTSIERSPVVQQAIQENETIRKLFEARMQHLDSQQQQFGANAFIGRVGAKPALG